MSGKSRKELGGSELKPFDWARFWSKVNVPPGNKKKGRCWIWTARTYNGYGQFQLNGACWYSHRIAYQMFFGDPKGMLVCHTCDNPSCVNPHHLFLGSNTDNQWDAAVKGRHRSKLTPDVVREIRAICIPNNLEFGYSALARKYNCNPGAIWQAVNKTRWRHVE